MAIAGARDDTLFLPPSAVRPPKASFLRPPSSGLLPKASLNPMHTNGAAPMYHSRSHLARRLDMPCGAPDAGARSAGADSTRRFVACSSRPGTHARSMIEIVDVSKSYG